jgi:hypothetical protein
MRIFKIAQTNYEQQEFPFLGEMPVDDSRELPIDEDGFIAKDELQQIIQKQNLQVATFSDLLKVNYSGKDYWLEDYDHEDYKILDNIQQWIYDRSESEALDILQIKEEDIYAGGIDSTIKDLRDNPPNLFHWTTEQAWKEIQKAGVLNGSSGSGINNHSAYGIFTSVDPEEHATGSYGNVCLEINLEAFQKDYGKSLNLHPEPEFVEIYIRQALAYHMGIEVEFESPNDVSPMTVVVDHNIPLKYVQRVN